jgi:hypothetical protein
MMANCKLVGAAGEHYVAYVLSCFDYICALVREGSPTIDLLASNIDGSKTISIQVKTSKSAKRKRGRGDNRKLHHLEFTLGKKAIQNSASNFIFCFVDLRGINPSNTPDVYVIPSEVIKNHYEDKDLSKIKWLRLHWTIEKMDLFKNNWDPMHKFLKTPEAET